MDTINPQFKKLVLVCTNERTNGRECCAQKGSMDIYKKLKRKIKQLDSRVQVSKTGCLGHCSSGTTVVVMPDDTWFGAVTNDDIDSLAERITK